MKVLWLCNIMIPFIAKSLKQNFMVKEGWLSGLSEQLIKHSEENNITLAICFPASENCGFVKWDDALFVKNRTQGVDYYIFREDTVHPEIYDASMEDGLREIIADFDPDIVHIFGTEFPHALAMVKAWGQPKRTLIGIQGLCSEIAKVYMAGLPYSVQKKRTFRDILKKDGLQQQQQKFVQRGKNEIEAIKLTGHITGRTDFDREVTAKINPNARYHFMNETLRDEFYQDCWNIDKIERYSIFLSQGNYPIKGLHYVLEALPEIIEKYPQTKIYIAGDIITANDTLKDKIKISGYGKYLLKMIKDNELEKNVVFLGNQQAGRMCARLLKTHVFLCPSAIENSPNSVGEAMLLGVPVVSADVGGVHNLLSDRKEGLLYTAADVKQMQAAIYKIFADDKLAMSLSTNARLRAEKTHDAKTNYLRLLEIYHEIDRSF
ncbi:MAG: glycosyltransferase [Lachnospiraceae bacterium]|nr:glycosyltransferase [Lachnospiraceae bacterium]